jgi:hypothetical protein
MRETVTYLEMTGPEELNPAAAVSTVTLEEAERGSPLIRDLVERVGRPHRWRSASWSDPQWTEFHADPCVRGWLVVQRERAGLRYAGITVYELHPGAEIEIRNFGLVHGLVGRGIGGHALTLALRTAWGLLPHVRRVWLHTSSLDHPNALPNYRKRGLRPYRTEIRERADPP